MKMTRVRRTRAEPYRCPRCGVVKKYYYRTAGKRFQMEGCTGDREACETRAAMRALGPEGPKHWHYTYQNNTWQTRATP